MEKRLQNLPTFNRSAFNELTDGWKNLSKGPGSKRTVIEWSTGGGPRVFVYPASDRTKGVNLLANMQADSTGEAYADWLEFEYVPQVNAAAQELGLNPQIICTDQRPIQVMRARRRTLAANGLAKIAMGGNVPTH